MTVALTEKLPEACNSVQGALTLNYHLASSMVSEALTDLLDTQEEF